jgi:hypothetical protein
VRHTGTLVGTVTEPSGRLALPGVFVFLPTAGLEQLPRGPGVRCPGCEDEVSGRPLASALTTATGEFRLEDVPAGQHRLVTQTGRWRREVQVVVTECAVTPLAPALTRLPRSRAEGDLPQMALVTGAADPFECLLLKLGISPGEFSRPDAGGAVQLYLGNGQSIDGGLPPGDELLTSLDRMLTYDLVFAPCRGYVAGASLTTRPVLQQYVDRGGRFFTTHYGYDWMMTPPLESTASWTPTNQFGAQDSAEVVTSFPRGAVFREWLTRVAGIGSQVFLVDPRYNVGSVRGATIAWLEARGRRAAADPNWSPQLTFTTPLGASAGCGRVAFSDFHVSTNALITPLGCQALPCPPPPLFPQNCLVAPFTNQEKLLVYILFDLGTCARNDREVPKACGTADSPCAKTVECCGALRCLTPGGGECVAGSCVCAP